MPLKYSVRTAVGWIRKRDPEFGSIIQALGPCELDISRPVAPFPALIRSIIYQQLSGKAANTIHTRFLQLFPGRAHPTPQQVLAMRDDVLRGAGLSANKLLAIQDLARKTISGDIPAVSTLHRWDNERIIEHLTQVRGIGRWTVEMYLMFRLGRPDVLPLGDLGIRNGFRMLSGRDDVEALAQRGELWAPYRTVASWYLWRMVDG